MSNPVKTLLVLSLISSLSACDPVQKTDIEDQPNFTAPAVDAEILVPEGRPYRPNLLTVSAIGRVETAPDIAVVIGTIEIEDKTHDAVYAEIAEVINDVQAIADTADTDMSYTQISAHDVWDEDCLKDNQTAAQRHGEIVRMRNSNESIELQIETLEKRMESAAETHQADISKRRARLAKLQRNRDIPEFRREIFDMEDAIERELERYDQSVKNDDQRLAALGARIKTPKKPLPGKVCNVTHVTGQLTFTARINPTEKAPDFMNQFTQAGVTDVSLYGYDFSDYDALYQKAAEQAVENARRKATLIAERAGSKLKKVKTFSVSQPTRFGRFGPQSRAVVSQPRYANTISIPPEFETLTETVVVQPQSVEYVTAPPTFETVTETVVVQEASTELITIPATYKNVTETIVLQPQYEYNGQVIPAITEQFTRRVVDTPARTAERVAPAVTKQETRRVIKTPASTQERVIPAVTKTISRRVIKTPARTIAQPNANGGRVQGDQLGQSNALRTSVLSGPQTVEVSALLVFDYETALDDILLR